MKRIEAAAELVRVARETEAGHLLTLPGGPGLFPLVRVCVEFGEYGSRAAPVVVLESDRGQVGLTVGQAEQLLGVLTAWLSESPEAGR